MDFSTIKAITIPEGVVKKIVSAGVTLWEAVSIKNWVRHSTESDGKTIYNGGLGYKNGYRVRSGGAEGTADFAACTGFIPVQPGSTVRIKGWLRYKYPGNSANAINAANSSFSNIGQIGNADYGIFASGGSAVAYKSSTIVDNANGISSWIVPPASSGVAYIRVSGFNNDSSDTNVGAKLIVTVDQEIPE